jgi:predicted  nucleic acid-binding Zn-ribbon protein
MTGMMDVDLLKIFLWIAFGGWSLYLTSERGRIVNDIKDIKRELSDARNKVDQTQNLLFTAYVTKMDHTKFEDRMTNSIDKLAERIDRALSEMTRLNENKKA